MLKVTNEFKDAMKAPIKVLNAKAHFLNKQIVSRNLYQLDHEYFANFKSRSENGSILTLEGNDGAGNFAWSSGWYRAFVKKIDKQSEVCSVSFDAKLNKVGAHGSSIGVSVECEGEQEIFNVFTMSVDNGWTRLKVNGVRRNVSKITAIRLSANGNKLSIDKESFQIETSSEATSYVGYGESENIFDGIWEYGGIGASTGQNQNAINAVRTKNYISVRGNTWYSMLNGIKNKLRKARFYDIDKNYIGTEYAEGNLISYGNEPLLLHGKTLDNVRYIRFELDFDTREEADTVKNNIAHFTLIEGSVDIPSYIPHTGVLVQSTDNLCSLKLKATGQLFLSTAKSAQLVTIGTDYGNLQSQRVVLYVGAKVASGDYDEVCLGSFVIHEQKVDLEKGMTTFNLLDDITLLSNIPYSASEVQFPCTVQKLIEKMSDINNFEIGTDLSKLPNASYTIKEDLWGKINGTTYRSTLDEVAGATACMVNLRDANNTIVFRNPEKVSQETLTYQNLKKVKFGGYYGKLNTVTLSRQPQEDNITVSNAEMVKIDGNKQAKLANNEILDDDREILATPILKAVEGYGFYETQIETEGHLWYEVGDRLTITDGTQSWETVVTDIDITVDGGVSEKLVCKAPAKAETNYSTTGSIYKSIWNTEIKVDKQGNEITSVVQQQNQFGDRVEDQFSKIEQDLHSITSSVQTIGGGNIIKNSVGYAKNADGKLSFWNKPIGNVKAVTSPESVSFGAISGNEIDLASGALIAQKVNVAVQEGSLYSLTAFVKKPTVGACRIRAYNEIDNFVVNIVNGTELLWKKVELLGFKPSMGYLVIELENIDADAMAVTDLMLSLGDTSTAWQQAPSEILNTQVALTENGVKVQSSVYDGDYVEITPLEFAGYSNAGGTTEKVFSLNRDTTQVSKINIEKQMYLDPIKVIPIKEGTQAGLAFVKSEEA